MGNKSFPDKKFSVVCGHRSRDNALELMKVDASEDVRTRYKEPFVLFFAQDQDHTKEEYTISKKLFDTQFTREIKQMASQSDEVLDNMTKKLFE